MKQLLVRAPAVVLVAAAALSAACSSDPTSPQAPKTARTPTSAAPSHFVGAVSAGATAGTPVGGSVGAGVGTGGTSTQSGYTVSWGRDGQPTPPSGQ